MNRDPRAEYRVFQRLRGLAKDRVVPLVTHRITNVAVADRVVVPDQGPVVREGPYEQLAAGPGPFRDLLAYQVRARPARAAGEERAG